MNDWELFRERETICSYCGPGAVALWEVILTDDEQVFVCDRHHEHLLDKELILFERRLGDMTWEENIELKEFLNEYERQKDTQ